MPTLRLSVFWCGEIDTCLQLTPRIFGANRTYAKQYGFDLEILPHSVREPPFVLPFVGEIISESLASSPDQNLLNRIANQNVRGQCDMAFKAAGRVPVVLGSLGNDKNGWSGYTVQSAGRVDANGRRVIITSEWLPWSISDPLKAVNFSWVVIHELVHASGFMSVGPYAHVFAPNDLMNKNSNQTIANPVMSDAAKASLSGSYFCW